MYTYLVSSFRICKTAVYSYEKRENDIEHDWDVNAMDSVLAYSGVVVLGTVRQCGSRIVRRVPSACGAATPCSSSWATRELSAKTWVRMIVSYDRKSFLCVRLGTVSLMMTYTC